MEKIAFVYRFLNGSRRANQDSKGGFTLMELLVYMAIVGIVVLLAGQAFSDSTKMRVRTQSMLKASELANNVGSLLRDDVAQMGAKSSKESSGAADVGDVFSLKSLVYNSETDSSSYTLTSSGQYDDFKFKRVHYDEDGKYMRVEEVRWFVDGNRLMRSCKKLDGTAEEDCGDEAVAVEIAAGVDSFKVYPTLPDNDSGFVRLFPVYPSEPAKKSFRLISYYGQNDYARAITNPETGGTSVSMSGFTSNYDEDIYVSGKKVGHMLLAADSGAATEDWSNCKAISFKLDSSVYEISFKLADNGNESRMFVPGRDHFAVGLRMVNSNLAKIPLLNDFFIFTPEAEKGTGKRSFRFSVPKPKGFAENTMDACVAFTVAFFSPLASAANISISDLQVNEITEMSYAITHSEELEESAKKMVKAFKIDLVIKKNGEAGRSTAIVSAPSNGVKG